MAYSKFLLSHWISPYLGEIGGLVVNVLIALLFFFHCMAIAGTDARTPSPLPPPSPPDEPSSSSVVSVLSSSTHTDTMTSANGSVDSFLEQEQASNSSQCESSLQLLLQPETPVLGAGVSVGTGTPSPAAELVESDVGVASGEDQNVLDTIIEALKSKDRLYVLKLGEQMDGLIKERG